MLKAKEGAEPVAGVGTGGMTEGLVLAAVIGVMEAGTIVALVVGGGAVLVAIGVMLKYKQLLCKCVDRTRKNSKDSPVHYNMSDIQIKKMQ